MSSVGDMIVNVSLVPVSEIVSQMIEEISATITAAKDVLIEQQSFAEVSSYLERLVPVLKELTKKNIHNYDSVNKAIDILRREIKDARQLTLECCRRKRVFLLVNCRRIVKSLQDTTREISRALSLIPLASLDLSSSVNNEINKLSDTMLKAEFRAAVMEENVIEKIESGIQERNADRSYANNLLVLIAQAVGISAEQSELKKLLDELKSEIEDAKVKKDQAEAIQMDQIIALLGSADAALSQREREVKYYTKRNSLGNQPLEPLKSFYCPITREVMVDPVETSSGQTFERDAIKKWLTDGKTTCPLTMIPLNREILRPNITLRKSIEEWKDRNTMITIASMRSKLSSNEEQEILDCLDQLKGLCEERESHREWVVLDNYIEDIANFLGRKNPQIRTRVLIILCLLAKDSDDNKEKIARLDSSIESIIKSLGKSIGEAKLALALLLELSKHDMIRNRIGQIKGCILLLVTLLNNDDTQVTTDAMKLLKNLSLLDQNVVQMAKANYFEPLLERLSSGSDNMKRIMAAALAEIELTDIGKSTLVEQGVLGSLLSLISDGDTEARLSAVKALYNLSTLHCNGLRMTREGAIGSLLHLLYFHGASPSPTLRELVAATIMNISMSAATWESGDLFIKVLDSDIMKLLSLVNMTGPGVQRSILRTFHALCKHPSAIEMRTKLRQSSLAPLLIQLFEQYEQVDQTIRADALKLFYCLIKDGDGELLQEHVGQRFLECLLRIMEVSEDEEEKTAAMGIISDIPTDRSQITRWLLDAGALQIVVRFLTYAQQNGASKSQLIENSVGVLCRFTVSTNEEWQSKAAEAGIIPLLVQLLESGSPLTKKHAASSLAQFSRNSPRLSRKVEKKSVLWCFSASSEGICPVHMGLCSVELSFCLVEADAVQPLVRVLGDPDIGACESALVALSTLNEDERLQSGSKLISEADGISAIIRLLSSSSSTELLEKALSVLERVFRLQEYKSRYGASAQLHLVELTQRGTVSIKPLAAKILRHLNLLPDQSSYFS